MSSGDHRKSEAAAPGAVVHMLQAEPGLRISRGPLNLGLICRQGTWDKRVYGNGITGEVTESSAQGATQRLAVNIRALPGLFTGLSGKGQYVIILTRNGTKLEGTFDGTYNGLEVKGRALGYVHRPVPTPNL